MSFTGYLFMVEEAGKNVRRNGLMSFAALTTVTIALTVLGGALLLFHTLNRAASSLSGSFIVAAFEKTEVPRDKSVDVQQRIQALPGVKSVKLKTKEEAYAELQQSDVEEKTDITTALDSNPLPDGFDITLATPSAARRVCAALRDAGQFPEIDAVRDDISTLDKLVATSRLVTNVGVVASIVLFLATAFVIQNTIRLTVYARRRDIRIMQLVGATPGFIRLPLILEGVFYGILGAGIAGAMLVFVASQLGRFLRGLDTPLAPALIVTVPPTTVFIALTGIGVFVGATGSVLSIRRFLKRI